MAHEFRSKQPDWVIEIGSPAPVVSSEAQGSLGELAALIEARETFEPLLHSSARIDVLVRDAVAGGATEHHIAVAMGLRLRHAEALVRGRSFSQLFTAD